MNSLTRRFFSLKLPRFNTLNQLVLFSSQHHREFDKDTAISLFNSFSSLKKNEPEYLVKYYDFMDYFLDNEALFKHNDFVNHLIQFNCKLEIKDTRYNQFIIDKAMKENFHFFNEKDNVITITTFLSDLPPDSQSWRVMEESFFENRLSFTNSEMLKIATNFLKKSQGSSQFWKINLQQLVTIEFKIGQSIHFVKEVFQKHSFLEKIDSNSQYSILIAKCIKFLQEHNLSLEDKALILASLFKFQNEQSKVRSLNVEAVSDLFQKYKSEVCSSLNKLSCDEIGKLLCRLKENNFESLDAKEFVSYFANNLKKNDFDKWDETTNKLNFVFDFLTYFKNEELVRIDNYIKDFLNYDLFWETMIEHYNFSSFKHMNIILNVLITYEVQYLRVWALLINNLRLIVKDGQKEEDFNQLSLLLKSFETKSFNSDLKMLINSFKLTYDKKVRKLEIINSHLAKL